MTPTPEQVAAWADGQLDGEEAQAVAQAVATSPALQAEVAAHRALRERLAAHFAPVMQQPPDLEHLRTLTGADNVTALPVRRAKPRWVWLAAPALAASVALVVMLKPSSPPAGYAGTELAAMLDNQLVADQKPGGDSRILLSFRAHGGAFCRAFADGATAGIACRDRQGWKLEGSGAPATGGGEYRQAGSAQAVMQQAQDMAEGDALGPQEEAQARKAGWAAGK